MKNILTKEAKLPIGILSRWKYEYSYDTFNYFINDYFNLELQEKFIKNKTYTDEEFKYLLHIYVRMKDYFDKQPDVWEMSLDDLEADKIEELIINLLSLTSMQRFMKNIRESEHYKGVGDFY